MTVSQSCFTRVSCKGHPRSKSLSRECHPRVSYKSVFPSLTVEIQLCSASRGLTSVTYNAYKSPMVCTAFKCIEGCGRCFSLHLCVGFLFLILYPGLRLLLLHTSPPPHITHTHTPTHTHTHPHTHPPTHPHHTPHTTHTQALCGREHRTQVVYNH